MRGIGRVVACLRRQAGAGQRVEGGGRVGAVVFGAASGIGEDWNFHCEIKVFANGGLAV